MTTPFVGRAGELATLTADLDAAVGGRGGVVLVAGEPGIGKTRLAEELAARATARGVVVLWGRCWEGAGAPSFWPWVQVVRGYVQVQAGDPASLRHDLGAGAADIAQLVPAVHDCIPDLPAPPPLEPEAARFRLFDSLAGFLRTAAARRPLLLVLDDLHWADVPSLALLRFMSRELEGTGPLVVGNYRQSEVGQGHPLLAAVADLTRGQHRWLLLGGLGQRDVASFVAMAAGAEASEELAAEVYRQTDGNPFFVTEMVRLLASQGRLDPAARGAAVLRGGLPEGVRAVVAERLGHLSGDCRRILEVAAVVGRDFELRVLQPASGLDAERLLVLLEEAEAARVAGAVPGGLSRWRFAHALVREVLYEGLLAARRVHLHGLVGEALEAVYAADPGPHLAELAHHLVRGGTRQRGDGGQGGADGHPGRPTRPGGAGLGGRGRAVRAGPGRLGAGRTARPPAALRAAAGGRRGQDGGQRRARRPHRLPAGRGAGQADRLARGARPGRPGPGVGVHQRDRRPSPGRAARGGADGPGARPTARCGRGCWPGWPGRWCPPRRSSGA